MALLIGITGENLLPDEDRLIVTALESGVDLIHLRKPLASCQQFCDLLNAIPERYYRRIVLHDFHVLAQQYAVHGIHLNRRFPVVPETYRGAMSRSCHTLAEVVACKTQYDYVFLSPVCDSISKQGYRAAFTCNQLEDAARCGTIDSKVIALGGISPDNIAGILRYGFGGVAVLGYLWREPEVEAVKQAVGKLKANMI